MNTIIVHNAIRDYPIFIGKNLGEQLATVVAKYAGTGRVVVVSHERILKLFKPKIQNALKKFNPLFLTFPAGEVNKNQTTVTRLQHQLLRRKFGRDTLIVALGGGVVGDLAGFIAATFLRGVPYIQVPTTLLAMVDSSVGGKVGIDTPYGKNTVGAFYPPHAVIIDLNFLRKLPQSELVNGLMEAVKTFLAQDKQCLELITRLNFNDFITTKNIWDKIIFNSVRIKAAIVGNDERESGERKIINFGHTIGHALELLSKFSIPHGIAVGYGMVAEMEIARRLGVLSERDFSVAVNYLKSSGLDMDRTPYCKFSARAITQTTLFDKKKENGAPQYVLLCKIGAVLVKDHKYAHAVPIKTIVDSLCALGCKK